MDLHLDGRVILVVGGRGLIGSAVTHLLLTEGALAIPAGRSAGSTLVMDAAEDDSVIQGMRAIVGRYGRLDGVVIAAAPSARTLAPSKNADPEQVRTAFDAKVMTFLRVANAALDVMAPAGYGRIVGVSGQNAFVTGNITGAVRNAALIIAAKNLADSVAGSGITVNTVSPAAVSPNPDPAVALARGGESSPAQIAALISFLVSPIAGAISGESIAVGHRVRGVSSL